MNAITRPAAGVTDKPAMFSVAFRAHVGPDLSAEARLQGLYLAVDAHSFAAAYSAVYDIARHRGALFLPDAVHDELQDWICSEILFHCSEFEALFRSYPRLGERVALHLEESHNV